MSESHPSSMLLDSHGLWLCTWLHSLASQHFFSSSQARFPFQSIAYCSGHSVFETVSGLLSLTLSSFGGNCVSLTRAVYLEPCLLLAEECEFPRWSLNLEYNDKMEHAVDLSGLLSFSSVIVWGRDELQSRRALLT